MRVFEERDFGSKDISFFGFKFFLTSTTTAYLEVKKNFDLFRLALAILCFVTAIVNKGSWGKKWKILNEKKFISYISLRRLSVRILLILAIFYLTIEFWPIPLKS